MLSIRQLEVFCEVILRGSISGAAASLGVAQPSVSNTIRRLEDVLGVKLFKRTGTRLQPTAMGNQVFEVVYPSLSALDQLTSTVMEVAAGSHATFRLGVSPSVSNALGPKALALFAAKHPETKLRMDTLSLSQIRDYLLMSEGNCAVTIFPVEDPAIRSVRISSIPVVCVLPKEHPLAGRQSLCVEDFARERLVFFHPNTPHGALVKQMFLDAGITPRVSIETRFAESAPHLMRAGFGLALMDHLSSLGIHDPEVRVLPIDGGPVQPVLLHHRTDSEHQPDLILMLECLRRTVRALGLPDS